MAEGRAGRSRWAEVDERHMWTKDEGLRAGGERSEHMDVRTMANARVYIAPYPDVRNQRNAAGTECMAYHTRA